MKRRLRAVLADRTGQINPALQGFYDHLLAQQPRTVARWLHENRHGTVAILRELADGTRLLTHDGLDLLSDSRQIRHLRNLLVGSGTLPARDEQMAVLQRWVDDTIDRRTESETWSVLHRYANWHLIRRLRNRTKGRPISVHQGRNVRNQVTAALALLDGLASQGRTLRSACQTDLERWLASEHATCRRECGNFVRWANQQKLTTLEMHTTSWRGPISSLDTEGRWEQARRLLHDHTLDLGDRVAALFVLLYAQWPATIRELTVDQVDARDGRLLLRFGHEAIHVPQPLAGLVGSLAQRAESRHPDISGPRWLFPGRWPHQPISTVHLLRRLRRIGIHTRQGRSTALFQLAEELPAAVLSRLLGIHIDAAVYWQRASSGDWTNYAADVSRKPLRNSP